MKFRGWASVAGAVLAALALTLALSACGGEGEADAGDEVASLGGSDDSSSGSSGGAGKKAADRREGALAFARCMRENGVDHPDPDENGMFAITPESDLDTTSETFRRAAEECQKYLGQLGEPPKLSAEERKRMEEQALALARCLRGQGIDMPDPDFGSDGGGFSLRLPDDFDPDDPDFREAQEKCRKYEPQLNGGGDAGPVGG